MCDLNCSTSKCKACKANYDKERYTAKREEILKKRSEYYNSNKENINRKRREERLPGSRYEEGKKYREKYRDEIKKRKAEYFKANYIPKTREPRPKTMTKNDVYLHKRRYHLKARYGITLEEFDDLLVKSDGLCLFCGLDLNDDICVDHEHESGKIRGLAHKQCNIIEGQILRARKLGILDKILNIHEGEINVG